MISRIPDKAFLVVALMLCVPAAWLLGNSQAEDRSQQQLMALQTGAEQEQLRLQASIKSLEDDIRQQELALEIAEARAAALQAEMDNSVKQSMDDKAELALYRRIAEADGERGVWVDELSRVESQPDVLSITLVQSRGRDRAVGGIGVTLFSGKGGNNRRWILSGGDSAEWLEVASAPLPGGQSSGELLDSPLSDDVDKVASFDLRFFQTLLVKVENITTIKPEYVEIWIFPESERLKPVVQRFRWAEVGYGR